MMLHDVRGSPSSDEKILLEQADKTCGENALKYQMQGNWAARL
jgi:hypothetical protein